MQKLGVFWKIQDFCYNMGTEIFKIEKEMIEKIKPKVGNPVISSEILKISVPILSEVGSSTFSHRLARQLTSCSCWLLSLAACSMQPPHRLKSHG